MSSTDGLVGNGVYDKTKIYKKYNAEFAYNYIKDKYKNSNLLDHSLRRSHKGFPTIWNLEFLKINNCMINIYP